MKCAMLVLLAFSLAGTAEAAKKKKQKKVPVATVEPAEAPSDPLADAERAYENLEYDAAIRLLEPLRDPAGSNPKARQRALLLTAFSYYFKREEPRAKLTLRELFRENADYAIDRDAVHPDLVRFFDEERRDYTRSLAVVAAPVETLPTPASSAPLVIAPAAQRRTLGDEQPWLRIFPIVGHFANYDPAGGAIFLALEIAFIGLNVGAAIAGGMLAYPNGEYRRGAVEAQILQNVGGIGAITTAVICIIDAFAFSPARGRARLAKE